MLWQWVTRGARLRHLSPNTVIRPARAIGAQNEIRRAWLAANSVRAAPLAGVFSTKKFQFPSHAFATAAGRPKADRSRKKATSAKRKKSTSTPKKELTEKQKEAKKVREHRELIKSLKEAALEPPKKLPAGPWALAVQGQLPGAYREFKKEDAKEAFKAGITRAKSLSAEEQERLNTQAEENKAANAATYAKWLQQYTPLQIKKANSARRRLARLTDKPVRLLHDDRLVKLPLTAYFHYYQERTDTGDFKYMQVKDISSRISEEWRGMNESEKQKYRDLQARDRARYVREYEEVYGEEPPMPRATRAGSA